MINITVNAHFDNPLAPQPCRESYTLCGKSDIPPFYTYSSSFAPPNIANGLLPRASGYHTTPILPGTFSHIANYNNGWAWVYNSSCQTVNLPYPCYWDILAENYSNGFSTLSHLINLIAQYHGVNHVYLPNKIYVITKFLNNINVSIHITASYNPINHHSIAHCIYVNSLPSALPHHITTRSIRVPQKNNIIEYIALLINAEQQLFNTKLKIMKANTLAPLIRQPI